MPGVDITRALGVGIATVERVRKRCVQEGIDSALNRREQVNRKKKVLDGEAEAKLIAIACGEPPQGRTRWSLKLLADELVELQIVEAISPETVRLALKKTHSSRG